MEAGLIAELVLCIGAGLQAMRRKASMSEMLDEQKIAWLLETAVGMLPEGCVLDVLAVTDDLSDLAEAELGAMNSWVPHRRNEFATGRRCARRALDAQGFEGSASLEVDPDGVPVWPEGLVGSISHSRGVAAAVATWASECSLIGLDLEKTNRLSEAAMKRVIHQKEAQFVKDDQVKATVLFSLKEAFYKAQFPRYRTPGNFHDLALVVDWAASRAEVAAMDARFADELKRVQFVYCLAGDYVLSVCWLES